MRVLCSIEEFRGELDRRVAPVATQDPIILAVSRTILDTHRSSGILQPSFSKKYL